MKNVEGEVKKDKPVDPRADMKAIRLAPVMASAIRLFLEAFDQVLSEEIEEPQCSKVLARLRPSTEHLEELLSTWDLT